MNRFAPLAFAALLWSPAVVRADGRSPLADSLQGPAKAAYESAKLLIGNHDFAGARAKFQEAYDASHDARLLFNVAACEKELHHYARMQEMLRRFERESGADIMPEERARADAALAAIASFVGRVRVTVDQRDATVIVDGDTAGTSPLAEPLTVDLGRHELRVEKAGYDPFTKTMDVNGGAETEIAVVLASRPRGGHLVIESTADAAIALDGHAAGTGRLDTAVGPGPHVVRLTANDKAPYEASVDLHDGETRTLNVTLVELHRASVWPWVVGGAAVVLVAGATVGGYFLFRPQQDRLAAPPDGAFGSVHFSALRF